LLSFLLSICVCGDAGDRYLESLYQKIVIKNKGEALRHLSFVSFTQIAVLPAMRAARQSGFGL
jgi:hypothetical protein